MTQRTALTALALVPVAVLARGAAFFVPVAIAAWWGVNPVTDAFFYVLAVPTFLLVIAANAMGTVVVPAVARVRATEPARVLDAIVVAGAAAAAVAFGVALGFTAALPALLPTATAFSTETRGLALDFAPQLVPFVTIVALNAVLKASADALGAFRLAAASPVIRTACALAVLWPGTGLVDGPARLPWAMALGALAEAAWLAGVARLAAGVGLAGLLPVPAGLAGTGAAFGPVLAGEAMVAFNLVVDKAFAGTLPSGSVTILEYADRARLIPQTLVEATLLPVAFTAWSAARARDLPRADAVRGSLRIVALVLPPVVAGLTVGRSALVHVLFERGAFDAAASSAVARTLAAFLPGVVFSAWGALVVRAHIVEGRYRLVMGLGACSFALNAGLDLLLLRHGTVGLAVSTTLTTALITVYSWSRLGVGARLGWDGWGVVAASTLLAAVLGPEDLRLSPGMLVAALPFVGLLAFGAWRAR